MTLIASRQGMLGTPEEVAASRLQAPRSVLRDVVEDSVEAVIDEIAEVDVCVLRAMCSGWNTQIKISPGS